MTKQVTLCPLCTLITAMINTHSIATIGSVVCYFDQVPSFCMYLLVHMFTFTELSLFSLRNMIDDSVFFFLF